MLAGSVLSVIAIAATAVNAANLGNPIFQQGQFSQQVYDGYNLLKHFGGNGPYTDGVGHGIDRNPPAQCEVDQVILIHRHGERWPDPSVAEGMIAAYKKILNTNLTLTGSLGFLNSWESFLDTPSLWAEETYSGPYAGLLNGFRRGVDYRARYGHLWNGESIPIFSSGYERIIETARRFGLGFFGYNYTDSAYLNIIPETADQGANSLTPVCYTESSTTTYGLSNFTQFASAASRLNAENKGLNLNASDVYNLMLLAPFELNGRPFSPWTDVFTLDEWVAFGYYNDLGYYYGGGGPGINTSAAIGAVYANATLTLLNQGPSVGKLFFNFCHDTNITPILTALGLFVPDKPMPVNYIKHDSIYKSTNFVPMGGHLVLERLSCNATSEHEAGTYVRTVVNEVVIPREDCQDGPGFSCPLANYTQTLNETLPDFRTACQVPEDYPQYLSFFWDFNQTNALNFQKGPIPYQLGATTWNDQPLGS
ncbi:secretory acid phosphatase [Scheffersomyces amazonensis]|uniref:secretory acid phosphatase n=1 Tax=Scheffersomyces amazonensis TaxID=1078765 RepID=UPI00315DF1FE